MKLRLNCPECSKIGKATAVQVEPTNEGRFEATCDAGHHFKMSAGYHDFQILFEIGINAIRDGYYREAIGSFTASYERFLEFFIRIVVTASGTSPDEYDKAWKHISNQSERQVGAFTFVFLLTYQVPPLLLSDKQKTLRNNVIHKGKIPTRADCVKYGDDIMKLILSFLRKLWQSHQQDVIESINTKSFSVDSQGPMIFYFPWMTLPTNREPPAEGSYPNLEALLKGVGQAGGQG